MAGPVAGPGTEFGSLRVSDAQVYWSGYFRHPEGWSFADELAAARAHFARWPPRVRAVVAATTASRLIRHDVYNLPAGLPAYVRGQIVVVGDAAHATLPTLGQGAATVLEDGVCVGRVIAAPVRAGCELPGADRIRLGPAATMPADRTVVARDRPFRCGAGPAEHS